MFDVEFKLNGSEYVNYCNMHFMESREIGLNIGDKLEIGGWLFVAYRPCYVHVDLLTVRPASPRDVLVVDAKNIDAKITRLADTPILFPAEIVDHVSGFDNGLYLINMQESLNGVYERSFDKNSGIVLNTIRKWWQFWIPKRIEVQLQKSFSEAKVGLYIVANGNVREVAEGTSFTTKTKRAKRPAKRSK